MTAGLYECFDNGESLGINKASYWSELIGIRANLVWDCAMRNANYKKRYRFVRVDKTNEPLEPFDEIKWGKEWDETVRKLKCRRNPEIADDYVSRKSLMENLIQHLPRHYHEKVKNLIAAEPAVDVVPVAHGEKGE